MEQVTHAISDLLDDCFDGRPIQPDMDDSSEASFMVHAMDGEKEVTISFDVSKSDDGLACHLEWVRSNDSAQAKGYMISVTLPGNSPVAPIYDGSSYMPTEIKISIFKNEDESFRFDYIMLKSLHPNGLISLRFMKEFLIILDNEYENKFDNECLYIVHDDSSNIRELYWLTKKEGMTYFQQEWNLQYDCILSLNAMDMSSMELNAMEFPASLAIMNMSLNAMELPASLALSRNEFPTFVGYQPVPQAPSKQSVFHFDVRFIGTLELYRSEHSPEYFQTKTIRNVLAEFIPRWTVGPGQLFTQADITMMARNTFVYFFRNHPNFTTLARIVLHGYDSRCGSMTGQPEYITTREFDFHFERENEEHVASILHDAKLFYIILFSFVSIIFIFYNCLNSFIQEDKEGKYFDMNLYVEL